MKTRQYRSRSGRPLPLLKRSALLAAFLGLVLALTACAPTAAPTPTPTKPPAAAPTQAAAPTKPPAATPTVAVEPTKPPAATPTPKPASLKLGIISSSGFAAIYLAHAKGYFKEQGIDLEIIPFRTTDELFGPLGTGQVDIIATSVSSTLLAVADRGVDFKIAAGTHATAPGYEMAWVLLRKDLQDSGQVKTPADLKGQKVSIISQGSIASQVAQMMIEKAGLKLSDVELLVLPSTDVPVALANKAIAAGLLTEPNVTAAVQKGFAVKWQPFSQFFNGKAQTGIAVFGPSLLKDQDVGRRWMLGYLKGSRYYLEAMKSKAARDEIVKVLIENTPVKDPAIYETMEWPFVDPNGLPDKNSIEAQYKYWVDTGFYKGKTTFDKITDLSMLEWAVQKMGKQ